MVIDKIQCKFDICLAEPFMRGNEWKYIKECLDSNWVSSAGKYVDELERRVADYIGRKYAVACVNGTSALHIALLVSGVEPRDEVIMPAVTFAAPAFALRYAQAYPVFMDVTPDIWQMDPQRVADFLAHECEGVKGQLVNKHTRRTIKAILPVHLLGHPVDMDPILDLAEKYSLKVIEDAAESLGALYKGKMAGSFGDAACLSFNGNKIITTGGGGMLLTDQEALAKKARYLTTQAKDDPLEAVHDQIGYNYRLTNIQAALGVAQLEQLDDYVSRKRDIARRYQEALERIQGVFLPRQAGWAESTFWLYTILVDEASCGISSRGLMRILADKKIQSRPLWHPLHTLKPFADCYAYKVKVAGEIYEKALSLPSSVGLTDGQQDMVIEVISKALGGKHGH